MEHSQSNRYVLNKSFYTPGARGRNSDRLM